MIVLGIDPGVHRTGFGVIESTGGKYKVLGVGVIETMRKTLLSERLFAISVSIETLLKKYKVDEMAVERLFFVKNITTGIEVGHARGVILMAAAARAIPAFSYTPVEVKQSVCGSGNAKKEQVGKMIKTLLNLKEVPKPDDAADGLAVAFCHLSRGSFTKATGDSSRRT